MASLRALILRTLASSAGGRMVSEALVNTVMEKRHEVSELANEPESKFRSRVETALETADSNSWTSEERPGQRVIVIAAGGKVEALADSSGLPSSGKNRWIKCDKCGKLGHKASECPNK